MRYICIILLLLPFFVYGQSNKLSIAKIKDAVTQYSSVKKNIVTKHDIEKTTKFVLSVSNGSLYIDTPYTITITSNNAHIEASQKYRTVSKNYSIDEKAYENFKQKLIEGQIHTEKDEDSATMCGAGCTQLTLYKNGKCYFNHNTVDSEEYLTFSGSLYSLFWNFTPKSLDELLDETNIDLYDDNDLLY